VVASTNVLAGFGVGRLLLYDFRKACPHLNNCAVEKLGLPQRERMWRAFPVKCVKAELLTVQ
jgi:hypothetical protein